MPTPDLLNQGRQQRRKIEATLDEIRAKFGKKAIGEGRGMERKQTAQNLLPAPPLFRQPDRQ